jgi:hypothetical protein
VLSLLAQRPDEPRAGLCKAVKQRAKLSRFRG